MDRRAFPRVDELVRLTIEQAKEHALILMEADGTIIGWLMGAERTFGYTAAEMVGRNFHVLFTPEDQRHDIPRLERETGTRPTVNGGARQVETNLLDFDGDLYGQILRVDILERLRGDAVFASLDELVAQLRRDDAETRAVLTELGIRGLRPVTSEVAS